MWVEKLLSFSKDYPSCVLCPVISKPTFDVLIFRLFGTFELPFGFSRIFVSIDRLPPSLNRDYLKICDIKFAGCQFSASFIIAFTPTPLIAISGRTGWGHRFWSNSTPFNRIFLMCCKLPEFKRNSEHLARMLGFYAMRLCSPGDRALADRSPLITISSAFVTLCCLKGRNYVRFARFIAALRTFPINFCAQCRIACSRYV